ncbi:hypothetical protein BURPS305_5875 [Burkholderia pseudomallei 305]|nr:hypothetical protein BURPS305_5086 [Burkholderia pseudomallei 305]EBA49995.1 hypothetical protein BURPS305_5875 [Burkholderia pseudomallei 305]
MSLPQRRRRGRRRGMLSCRARHIRRTRDSLNASQADIRR